MYMVFLFLAIAKKEGLISIQNDPHKFVVIFSFDLPFRCNFWKFEWASASLFKIPLSYNSAFSCQQWKNCSLPKVFRIKQSLLL